MKEAVILLSGGMDSATLIGYCLENEIQPHCLNINYGQKHQREIDSAKSIAKCYDFPFTSLDLSIIRGLLSGSALTDDIDVPEGYYKHETMKSTVVPNRNAILLSIGAGYAISLKADYIMIGAHGGDHDIYPDCRREFLEPLNDAFREGNYHKVNIRAPFLYDTKSNIVQRGIKYNIPYELTWTCYNGGKKACGKCGSCIERLEAFKNNGIEDPLEYEK